MRKASEPTVTTVSQGPTGTYPCMAPEMFTTSHRGPAVDIYSLGCLLIELFGLRRVWPGLDGMQIMQKVCGAFNSPPVMPDIGHLPNAYQSVCEQCCQIDPTQRPTVAAVAAMILYFIVFVFHL